MSTIVTIDGPAGAGKSSVAKKLAALLELDYLDTGSVYRALAWQAMIEGISFDDEDRCTMLAEQIQIEVLGPGRIAVNGHDVTDKIRTAVVSDGSSKISAILGVRMTLLELQRQYGLDKGCVVDGRDTGTVIFPEATLKIFLTADEEVRFQRRAGVDGVEVAKHNAERDKRDSNRAIAPLHPADDAITIDSTNLTEDQVVERIAGLLATRLANQEARSRT